MDQGHLKVFPKLDDPRQQGLHTTAALLRADQNSIAMTHAASSAKCFLAVAGQLLCTRDTCRSSQSRMCLDSKVCSTLQRLSELSDGIAIEKRFYADSS